jgi:hypothetical protein
MKRVLLVVLVVAVLLVFAGAAQARPLDPSGGPYWLKAGDYAFTVQPSVAYSFCWLCSAELVNSDGQVVMNAAAGRTMGRGFFDYRDRGHLFAGLYTVRVIGAMAYGVPQLTLR